MRTANDPEMAVESIPSVNEPTLLDHWRFERRVAETRPTSDWRAAVPAELFERLRALSAAAAVPSPAPVVSEPTLAERLEADSAAGAALPFSYRAPFLPEVVKEPEHVVETLGWDTPAELLPEEPSIPVRLPSAFLGLDWSTADEETDKVLVSLRPVLSADLADKVVELLDRAPGMHNVKSLGNEGDVAAFEAEYRGPVVAMEAVNQALKGIGASLVSTGDREFYLAIQGQAV